MYPSRKSEASYVLSVLFSQARGVWENIMLSFIYVVTGRIIRLCHLKVNVIYEAETIRFKFTAQIKCFCHGKARQSLLSMLNRREKPQASKPLCEKNNSHS